MRATKDGFDEKHGGPLNWDASLVRGVRVRDAIDSSDGLVGKFYTNGTIVLMHEKLLKEINKLQFWYISCSQDSHARLKDRLISTNQQ
ncbi:MAG: hypothetical protein V4508_26120 [Pseudomonadota bacterium]